MIPSHILEDDRIDDATALLFGRIASLTNDKGYCWASDKYLADLTRVSVQELKKRLKKLEMAGYLIRETKKVGFQWVRKIFLNFSNNNYEGAIRRPRKAPFGAPYIDKHEIYKKKTTTVVQKEKPPTPQSEVATNVARSSSLQEFKKLKLSPSFEKRILKKYDPDKISKSIQRVLSWKGRLNDEAALLTALQRFDEWGEGCDKKTLVEANKSFLATLKVFDGITAKGSHVSLFNEGISFSQGCASYDFFINDINFIEKTKSYLKKLML